LPIPIGRNAATVELDPELRDRDGSTLWSEWAKARSCKLFWLYSPNAKVAGEFGLEIHRFGGNAHGIDRNSL